LLGRQQSLGISTLPKKNEARAHGALFVKHFAKIKQNSLYFEKKK
jgi:hypothetical protein